MRHNGLTLVCFSVAHCDAAKSNELMQIQSGFNFLRAVDAVHDCGLAVRLNFTMLRSGIYRPEDLDRCVDLATIYGIEQLTFREVSRPAVSISQEHADCVDREKPNDACRVLFHYLNMNGGHRLPDLAHGAALFNYRGQNVSVNHCLTDTTDPNDIRQIIFFPSGEICYDWKYRGARLL